MALCGMTSLPEAAPGRSHGGRGGAEGGSGSGPPVPPALRSRCRRGLPSPRVSPQRQREEPADTSDLSGEDDDDYVPYVPVKQRKQQMVMG